MLVFSGNCQRRKGAQPIKPPHLTLAAGEPPAEVSATSTEVVRQASVRFSGLMVDKFLGYGFMVLVTKSYGPDAFGVYLFGVGAIEVALGATRLGLDRAAVRAVSGLNATGKPAEIKGVVRASLLLTLPVCVAITVVGLLFNDGLAAVLGQPRLDDFMRFAALAIPASVFADVLLWSTEGLGYQKYVALIRMMIEPAIKTAIAVGLFLVLGKAGSSRSLGLAYTVSVLISAIIAYAVYRRRVAPMAVGPSVERHVPELLRVGLPFCGLTILSRLLARADTFLIFAIVSAKATAHYTVALRTALLTTMIALAFDAAFRPAMARILAVGRPGDLAADYLSVSRSVFVLCLPACVVLGVFPERVMTVIGGQFSDAAAVCSLIAVATAVGFALGPAASALAMAGRTRVPLVNGLIAGAIGLALNVALIPRLGLAGAGAAQCISIVVSSVLNAVSARRLLGVSGIGRGHASLVVASVVAAVAGLVSDAIAPADKYAALAVVSSVVVLVYLAVIWAWGIRPEDKQLISNLLRVAVGGNDARNERSLWPKRR
ncbi:MAG TPA: flippase [Blastocatellia bacterium]|nr:flippase [Blastocatellia bacterium]